MKAVVLCFCVHVHDQHRQNLFEAVDIKRQVLDIITYTLVIGPHYLESVGEHYLLVSTDTLNFLQYLYFLVYCFRFPDFDVGINHF